MLPAGFTSVREAGSRDDFLREVVRFSQNLGFNTVSAMAVVDFGMGRSEFVSIDNAPAGFATVAQNAANIRRDPVMQHCRRHTVPIIWDQATYTGQGLGELWEEQARFGYHTGIAMALHLPEGRHFAFGVERDQPLPSDTGELSRLVADLQLFAVHAQDAAMRLLAPFAAAGRAAGPHSRASWKRCAGPWRARPPGRWAPSWASASARRCCM
jgi:hypothetical protein